MNSSTGGRGVVVVDSGGFIRGVRLEQFGCEFYTIPEVLLEIRDKKSRYYVESLPFQVKTREPHPDAVKAVVDFAKKTGDYHSLSPTDIKVLSLTYTLHKEIHGISLLRSDPLRPTLSQKKAVDPTPTSTNNTEKSIDPPQQPLPSEKSLERDQQTSPTRIDPAVNVNSAESVEGTAESKNLMENKENVSSTESSKNVEDDDNEGWITPDNITQATAKLYGEQQSKNDSKVGCLTTDYGMQVLLRRSTLTEQNVLLQMGLNLISVDGFRIKKLKQWILRCHGCNKSTRDMSKVFCPHCGNNTLVRVPVLITESGEIIYLNYTPKINLRGSKYSIPTPKGGKNSSDLILTEEEYEKALRLKSKKKSVDAFDPEFSFANSKSGSHSGIVVGYGKKNPNVSRRKVGKTNKNKMNI